MDGKIKRFLREESVPTVFSFVPETARKHGKSSIRCAEKFPKSCEFKKPVPAISTTNTYKGSTLPQKNALAQSL